MACQKVCKQGRDDIQVNLQSPVPTSFLHCSCKLMCKQGFVHLPSLLYHPYLVCILFGMPSLHHFTFLMFFNIINYMLLNHIMHKLHQYQ